MSIAHQFWLIFTTLLFVSRNGFPSLKKVASCTLNRKDQVNVHQYVRVVPRCFSSVLLYEILGCSLPDSSVCRILQARILEWIIMSSSRGSLSRGWTCVSYISCIDKQVPHYGAIWEACMSSILCFKKYKHISKRLACKLDHMYFPSDSSWSAYKFSMEVQWFQLFYKVTKSIEADIKYNNNVILYDKTSIFLFFTKGILMWNRTVKFCKWVMVKN